MNFFALASFIFLLFNFYVYITLLLQINRSSIAEMKEGLNKAATRTNISLALHKKSHVFEATDNLFRAGLEVIPAQELPHMCDICSQHEQTQA